MSTVSPDQVHFTEAPETIPGDQMNREQLEKTVGESLQSIYSYVEEVRTSQDDIKDINGFVYKERIDDIVRVKESTRERLDQVDKLL